LEGASGGQRRSSTQAVILIPPSREKICTKAKPIVISDYSRAPSAVN